MARAKSTILEAPQGASSSSDEQIRQLREEVAQCEREIKDEQETHARNIRALEGKLARLQKDLGKLEAKK